MLGHRVLWLQLLIHPLSYTHNRLPQETMFRIYLPVSFALIAVLCGTVAAQDGSALARGLQPPPFWIGVKCAVPEDEVGKIQVMSVVAETPADKAGLRVGDQIVAVNGDEPQSVEDLVRLIQRSQGSELRFSINRDDRELEVKLSPRRRRAAAYTLPELQAQELAEWIRRHAQGGHASGLDMTLINPGVVLDPTRTRFPAGTSFTLQRQEDGPVTLTIQRGDEKWAVLADDLADLPEDLRPWAARLLGTANSPAALIPQLPPDIHLLLPTPLHSLSPRRSPDDERIDLRQRLDDLSRQLDALRQTIEQESKGK